MSQRLIVTFDNVAAYRKYKEEIIKEGGMIKPEDDLGETLMGFTAVIPSTVLAAMKAPSLGNNGIHNIEADSVVTIQQQ